MQSKILPLLLVIIIFFTAEGQKVNVDSLIDVTLDEESIPSDLFQAHNRLSRYYLRNDTTKAYYHLDQLESLALKEKDTTAMIMAGDLKVRRYVNKSQYDRGEAEVREMLRLSVLIDKESFISNCYNSLGVIKSLKNEYDSVLYYFDTVYRMDLAKPDVDQQSLINSLNNLAATAIRFNKYDESLSYFLEALDISEKSGNDRGISMANMGLGNVYQKLNEQEKSRVHLRKALQYGTSVSNHETIGDALHNIGGTYKKTEPDSAIYYYKRALESYKKVGNKERIGLSAMATGDALINAERPDEALQYYSQAHTNYLDTRNRKRTIDAESRLAKVNFEIGKFKRAEVYIGDVVAFYDNQEDLESSSKAYLLQSKISEKLGDLQLALSSQRQHQILKDSLDDTKYNKDVSEITTKYETEAKDAEILKQQNEIENKTRDTNFFRAIAALIGTIGFLVFFFMRNKLRQGKLLSEQEALLQSQKIIQLEKEKKILGMNAMIEGQEAERTRIAKDLHDGLGGLLSTVKAHFSNIQSEIQKIEKINVYNKANELVDEACDEVRRISHNLMPGALRLEGLKSAIEHLGEEMNDAHPFTVKVEAIGLGTRMEESKEVFVYRIIQEALNNIIKHADAKDVLIQLSETEDEYHFIVEDDGKGFDPLQMESGLGLKSIQSRVDFLKGSLDVDTRIGVGTTLSWYIPKS